MAWVTGNRYLTQSEMENNAKEFYNYMTPMGWTVQSISAMLGNMQTESTINPGIWEKREVNIERGYGLVQWTPSYKYTDWAGEDYANGNMQCERIQFEMENGIQWFANDNAPTVEPPLTFREFALSTLDVGTLANYFLWYYEHPAETIQPARAEQAEAWYEFLTGLEPEPPAPIIIKKKMPVWMMIRPY